MRFLAIIVFTCFYFHPIRANMDFITALDRNNIHIRFSSGLIRGEIDRKMNIFLELADKLLQENPLPRVPLLLEFTNSFFDKESSPYTIRFGNLREASIFGFDEEKVPENGLVIQLKGTEFNIGKTLCLLNGALRDLEYIKVYSSDAEASIDENKEKLSSIPSKKIEDYSSLRSEFVGKLLANKFYGVPINSPKAAGSIQYFFQGNQYHIYHYKPVGSATGRDSVFLILDDIQRILGKPDDGYFLFSNDSTFFYVHPFKNEFSGPILIEGFHSFSFPIIGYTRDRYPFERFVLLDHERLRKALFVPDKNLIISDYDELEREFLMKITHSNRNTGSGRRAIILFLLVAFLTGLVYFAKKV